MSGVDRGGRRNRHLKLDVIDCEADSPRIDQDLRGKATTLWPAIGSLGYSRAGGSRQRPHGDPSLCYIWSQLPHSPAMWPQANGIIPVSQFPRL